MAIKVSKNAFVVMAHCESSGKKYGITVDEERRGRLKFVWAFPIDEKNARKEGYDTKEVRGEISYGDEYPGCPHCGAMTFWQCECGAINCWDGQRRYTCQNCGKVVEDFTEVNEFNIKGGGF